MDSKLPLLWLFGAFLYLVVLSGPKDPPSAPALASHYEAPAPALTYETFPWPPLPDDYPPGGCPVVAEAHSPNCQCVDCFPYAALGDWAWAEAVQSGHCPVSRAAVTAQGVGE